MKIKAQDPYNMRKRLLTACTLVALTMPAQAGDMTSVYTTLDLKKNCQVIEETEEGGSVSLLCMGYKNFPIHFSEGDLRHSVQFGYVDPNRQNVWQSFAQWNRISTTVEWRLRGDRPVAAILRWFIENTDDAGSADPTRVGQVLVVSRVGQQADRQACVVGYIDALANSDANVLARELADSEAADFTCGAIRPGFHGERGNLSGNPN